MVLRQVQDDLESEGFEVQCFLIPASGIGAWHQRYRVWIVGHSEHNGSLTSKIKRRNTETATGTQEGTNTTSEPARTSGSRNDEDVSNTERKGLERFGKQSTTFSGQDSGTQFGSTNSSRSREEDVSNTEIIGTGEPRNIDQEKGNQSSSSTQSNSSSENVSNTDSGVRRGWRTIGKSGEDKVWRFYSEEEEQTRVDIRSETIGRDAVFGETDISYTHNERWKECNVSDQSEEQILNNRRHDTNGQEQTWWQIESNICGIPNGISYGLDKDRANRIKTLGNAIVPQIARELGLAIKKVLYDNTDI
jgi:site-specific DNA-cytosine methylase